MKKILKFAGIGLAAIAVILLLIIGYAYGTKFVAKLDRLPEGTGLVLVDTSDKPSQSAFSNQASPHLGWPVSQTYQKYAENFHWWLMDFQRSGRTGESVREDNPTLAVVFDLPAEDLPALAAFPGTVKVIETVLSNNEPAIAIVELQSEDYIAVYERLLASSVKDGAIVKQGDTIGTIAIRQTAVLSKDDQWKKKNVIGSFNFKFSLFKILVGGDREPVWITTGSFAQ